MVKRQKQVERPISELVRERKAHYVGLITGAIESVYQSGNFGYIEKFERVIQKVAQGVKEGTLERSLKEISREITPKDRRPILNYDTYVVERNKGMTNEQIKEKYRLENQRQMSAFGSNYAKSQKKA